jgi:hypothetical protein
MEGMRKRDRSIRFKPDRGDLARTFCNRLLQAGRNRFLPGRGRKPSPSFRVDFDSYEQPEMEGMRKHPRSLRFKPDHGRFI